MKYYYIDRNTIYLNRSKTELSRVMNSLVSDLENLNGLNLFINSFQIKNEHFHVTNKVKFNNLIVTLFVKIKTFNSSFEDALISTTEAKKSNLCKKFGLYLNDETSGTLSDDEDPSLEVEDNISKLEKISKLDDDNSFESFSSEKRQISYVDELLAATPLRSRTKRRFNNEKSY